MNRADRLSWPALIGVLIGAAIMVAPLVWTLLLSVKSNAELMSDSANAFSAPYTLENYRAIFAGSLVPQWLLNSTIVALGTTVGVLILCSLAGYGFSRFDFPFRRSLFAFVVVGLAIPERSGGVAATPIVRPTASGCTIVIRGSSCPGWSRRSACSS